jgi:hypothetical protein
MPWQLYVWVQALVLVGGIATAIVLAYRAVERMDRRG